MENIRENDILNQQIEIQYRIPKLFNRVLANLVDIIIFVFLFVGIFLGVRGIIKNTDYYKTAKENYENACIESGLYKKTDKNIVVDLITYISNNSSYTAKGKRSASEKALDQFYNVYLPSIVDNDTYFEILEEKKEYFLSDSLKPKEEDISSVPFFIEDQNEVIANPELEHFPGVDAMYYAECYKPFIDKYSLRQFQSYSEEYRSNVTKVSNLLIFTSIPIAYVTSGLLVWFVPPLFFIRGRKTLGKALYHMGLIQSNFYSISNGKWIVRFLIFFFGEMILSVATLGIPFIVSFTMMLTTKHKQGFPDYMLGIYEVDTSNNKIYKNEAELTLDNLNTHKEPIDFKMKDLDY